MCYADNDSMREDFDTDETTDHTRAEKNENLYTILYL